MTHQDQQDILTEEAHDLGTKVLGLVLAQPKNAVIFEKHLYKQAVKAGGTLTMYKWYVYQVVGHLMKDKGLMKPLLKTVKKGGVGWNDCSYDETRHRLDEYYSYIVSPFEVTEGVVECTKCGSMKTWSVQKQTRGSDEPMTTFSKCTEPKCGHEFIYNG